MPIEITDVETTEKVFTSVNLDLSLLEIKRIVIHQVFARKDQKPISPEFADELTVLNASGLGSIQNRVVKALGSASHGVQMEISNSDEGGFFDQATRLLDMDDDDFLVRSQGIADMLNSAQSTRDLPGGALVIFTGVTGADEKRFIAVIKAEVHDGFNLGKKSGSKSAALSYLDKLLLTPAQRLYKIGLLLEVNSTKTNGATYLPDNFAAFLYDQQMNASNEKGAAQYFHRQFLGFEVVSTSKQQIKLFYTETKSFISKKVTDQAKKLDLYDSLYVALKVDQGPTLSISDFAQTYFSYDAGLRDEYIKAMTKKGFPQHAIQKDISLLSGLLKRRKLNFTGSVVLSAPAEKFKELVVVDEKLSSQEETVVRIKGRVESQE